MHSIFDFGLTSFFVSLCVISWINFSSYFLFPSISLLRVLCVLTLCSLWFKKEIGL